MKPRPAGPLLCAAPPDQPPAAGASFVESGAAWGLPSGMAPEQITALYEIAQYRADQQKKRGPEAEAAALAPEARNFAPNSR